MIRKHVKHQQVCNDDMLGLFILLSLQEFWETFQVCITSLAPEGIACLRMIKGCGVLNKDIRM